MGQNNEEPSREAQRQLKEVLVHRYGLDSWQRQDDVDEIARIARAIWRESILVTAVLGGQVVLLGSALVEGDNVDWTVAIKKLSPVAALRGVGASATPVATRKVVVVDDAANEMQSSINDNGDAVGFYAFAPIHLPLPSISSTIPVGGFIVVSPHSRPAGSFTPNDQALLLSLSNLVVKELQRGHDSISLNKKAAQAGFVGRFLELALTATSKSSSPTRPASRNSTPTTSVDSIRDSTASSAVSALRSFQSEQQTDTFSSRHAHVFDAAVEALCDVAPGSGALILDLRAFSCSTALDELDRRVRPNLQPITVLTSRGFDDVESRLTAQEGLQGIERALLGWRENPSGSAFRTDALSFLLPDSSRSSLSIPILDHTGTPVLLVLVTSPDVIPLEDSDKSGQLDLMREEATEEEALKFSPLLTIANVCLDSLRSILDDTLDFAKLTSDVELGTTLPLPTNDVVDLPVFLTEVAKSCWTRKMKMSSASGVDGSERSPSETEILDIVFSFAARAEGWKILCNAGELRRIVSNVFSNALVFTHDGFVILQLDAAPAPGTDGLTMLSIKVSDSGIGMDAEFLEHQLFAPFVQGDTFSPGCGLGMSIVKDLVGRMRGTVTVDSQLGEGTTVQLHLPIQVIQSPTPAPEAVQVLSEELGLLRNVLRQRKSNRRGLHATEPSFTSIRIADVSRAPTPRPEMQRNDSYDSTKTHASNGAASTATDGTAQLRVLCAEDNMVAQALLKRFLTKKGFDVRAVDDGQEAVDEFKREYRPDLSVLDIGMPRKDGFEAAFEIRAHEEVMGWERHRMIALTALSSAEERQKGVGHNGAPFDRWLVKGSHALKLLDAELLAMQARMGEGRSLTSSG